MLGIDSRSIYKILFSFLSLLIVFLSSCEKEKSPVCVITEPEDYSVFGKGEVVKVSVDARDPNGNNLEVLFFLNDQGVFSTSTFPYSYLWDTDGFESGDYILKVIVVDNEGRKSADIRHVSLNVSKPVVNTSDVNEVALTSAIVGGSVTSDGGSAVTETGVYWSTMEHPELNGTKFRISMVQNKFSASITGLSTNTPYYFTAYAKNSQGETLGEAKAFTTLGNEIGIFVDSRDNREYGWVRIGTQTWMSENLAYLPEVYPPDEGSSLFKRFYVFDYSGLSVSEAKGSEAFDKFAVLYNWNAALSACPPGWHLPSDEEWKELEINLGMNRLSADNAGWRGSYEGRLLKAKSGWNNEGNGSNLSDFTALPGGYRLPDGTFRFQGVYGNWWSASEYSTKDGWARYLYYNNTGVYRGTFSKEFGFSVRCVKD